MSKRVLTEVEHDLEREEHEVKLKVQKGTKVKIEVDPKESDEGGKQLLTEG